MRQLAKDEAIGLFNVTFEIADKEVLHFEYKLKITDL